MGWRVLLTLIKARKKSQDPDSTTTSEYIDLVNKPLGPIYDDIGDWQNKIEDTPGAV
jgi:hypothetical protein